MTNDENDKLLDHEYDGIQELDNNLPLWWLWTFFGAIIFGFIYWIHFSLTGDGPSLDEELTRDMAKIEQQRKQSSQAASGGASSISPDQLVAMGEKIYKANCASCHKEDGGGSIGPNLTDAYWIHGADVGAIKQVVMEGVLDKGMPPWKAILRPQEVESVVSYVISLNGDNVKDGKAPQGEKVE